jgi:hypothetical protein
LPVTVFTSSPVLPGRRVRVLRGRKLGTLLPNDDAGHAVVNVPDRTKKAIRALLSDVQFWIPLAALIGGVLVLRWVG